MQIPIPLCASHNYGGGSMMSAFVRVGEYVEVESRFHANGLRVGDQSGHYGAYIDAGNIGGLRFPIGSFVDWDGKLVGVNDAFPEGFTGEIYYGTSREWGGSKNGWVYLAWQDADYQYLGRVRIVVQFDSKIVGDQVLVRYKPGKCYVSITRATHAAVSGIQPGSESATVVHQRCLWKLPNGTMSDEVAIPEGVVDITGSGQRTGTVDASAHKGVNLQDLWDPGVAYDKAWAAVASAEAEPDRSWAEPYALWCYTLNPTGESIDYPKLFSQLLHTYEFSDPWLATGAVAREAHLETREVRDDWGHLVKQNVWIPRGGPYGSYVYEWLTQHAWVDAVKAIPKANDNSIQNLQAAFELLAACKSGNVAEIPDILWDQWKSWTKSAHGAADFYANTWLRYRYEFSTTKMDIDEYVKFGLNVVDRYMNQITSSRCHGHATYGDYECNCSMTWSERGLTGLSKFFHSLWRSGLEPNAYVLWDFVPFSFVVDWFTPVGDVLQTYSDMQYRNEAYYEFSDIVFSIRYRTGPVRGYYAQHFVRWVAPSPPVADESYWFDDGDSSTGLSTKFKRVCDSGALIYGIVGKR